MNLDLYPALRDQAATWLDQPPADLDPPALMTLLKSGISAERDKRAQAAGGGSTLTLNALLDIELKLHTQVFGLPREVIKPKF